MLKIKDNVKLEELEKYVVYEHIFPNGKRYIGISSNPQRRWANGLGYNHNIYMKRAIQKYGWHNIEHHILFDSLTKSEAEQKEIELIAFYKSTNPKYGYNIDNGGNSIGKHSENSINKMRQYASNRPKKHNEKISKSKLGKSLNLTQEQREKLSIRFKGNKYGSGNFLGKHHTIDTKNKISLRLKGKPSWNKGKKRTYEHTKNNVLSHQKCVLQYDIKFNIINEFPSIKIAQNKTKINNISKACRGVQKTAGGYIWKYKIQAGYIEKVEE